MPYPIPSNIQPINPGSYPYDQFGSQASYNPYVSRSTAGSLGPGQTLISACGRVATSTSATVTVPLFTVPTSKTFFETDFNLSTIAAAEIDVQVTAGTITIDREVTSSTSPINAAHETQPFAPGGVVVSIVFAQTAAIDNVDFFVAGYFQAPPPF